MKSKSMAISLYLLSLQFVYAEECPDPECPKPCPVVCFERGYPDTKCCLPSAYNEPAQYGLSPCAQNFWFDTSFTYSVAYQEGMDLAQSSATLTGVPLDVPEETFTLFQDTQWKPGFKIGLGSDLGHDHWSWYAEYAWFRSKTRTSAVAPGGPDGSALPVWKINNWELTQDGTASAISSNWRLRMDLLDLAVTRPYYQGTHLIIAPFGGIRATWIRQNLRIESTPSIAVGTALSEAIFHHRSASWGLGPRAGFQGEWHLGYGLRLEGDVAASLLFTRYTDVSALADPDIVGSHPHAADYSNYNTIRYNNDMNIGIGWGRYFECRDFHLDLLLTYDFQVFWNQNMMRVLVDNIDRGVSGAAHNLYLQGMTLRAQFDF